MMPLLISTKFAQLNPKTDLKSKLIDTFTNNTNKVFTKDELIEIIYEVENISNRSERLQESYATSLRKLIQRTRELMAEQFGYSHSQVEWLTYSRKQKGWKLYQEK